MGLVHCILFCRNVCVGLSVASLWADHTTGLPDVGLRLPSGCSACATITRIFLTFSFQKRPKVASCWESTALLPAPLGLRTLPCHLLYMLPHLFNRAQDAVLLQSQQLAKPQVFEFPDEVWGNLFRSWAQDDDQFGAGQSPLRSLNPLVS